MSANNTVTIQLEPEKFYYDGKKLTIIIDENKPVVFLPDGVFRGYRWHDPMKIDTVGNVLLEYIEKMVCKNDYEIRY